MNEPTTPSPTPAAPRAGLRRYLPPLFAASLVALLGYALLKPASDTTTGGVLVGREAPAFALTTPEGQNVTLAALRGRPVVLNFWASWCDPCREEAPLFNALNAQARPDGLAVVGVLFQEPKLDAAKRFAQQYGLNYPHLLDPRAATAIDYGVSGIPETVFIDPQGVIRHIDRGGLDLARLNAGLGTIGVPALKEGAL
ncbi:TlpA disulfide reductase family protein [Deinococcus ficus]|uniref:Thiol:disulfide interchange protein n=1 Tax=Deinococcus ficus TaxID=317577 RepID=A0A221SUG2_9DEIO|nr:TlpA disulfide reductase family protein [Deinococcus ficus]ASN80282.1 thiol:disulfide interchange protein [Deinococcus ficus]